MYIYIYKAPIFLKFRCPSCMNNLSLTESVVSHTILSLNKLSLLFFSKYIYI